MPPLTAYGQLFARDVRPALESLAQFREGKDDNDSMSPLMRPRSVHLPGNQPAGGCSTTTNTQLTVFKFTRSLQVRLSRGGTSGGGRGDALAA
jgi:hypothetical protein